MHSRHKISIVCILVIVFQIAQCAPSAKTVQTKKISAFRGTNNIFSSLKSPLPGYHYTTMAQVTSTFKPGTYEIMPLKQAKKIIETEKKKLKKEKSCKESDENDDGKSKITKDHDDDDGKVEVTEDHNGKDHKDGHNDDNDKEEDKNIHKEKGDTTIVIEEESDNVHHNSVGVKEKEEEENDDHGKNEEEDKDKNKGHGNVDDEEKEKDTDIIIEKVEEANDRKGDAGDVELLVEHIDHKDDAGGKEEHKTESEDDQGSNVKEKDVQEDAADFLEGGTIEIMEENAKDSGSGAHKKEGQDNQGNNVKKKVEQQDAADFLEGGTIEIMEGSSGAQHRRKKRDFFSFKLPFMSSDKDVTKTDTTVTSTTTTSTTAATGSKESTTVTDTKVSATAVAGSGSKETIAEVTTVQTTDSSTGLIDGIEMHIVAIGKDVSTSLKVAAPYLPMVWKVSQFLIPGLSQYQMLVLTVNVAMVTAEALQKYDSGQSVQSIVFDAAKKAIMSSILRKRDGGSMISNMYESLKTRFGKYFSGDETTKAMAVKIDETTKDVEKIETEVTAINGEITKTEVTITKNEEKSLESINKSNDMTEKIEKKIMKMRKGSDSNESSMSGSNSDSSDEDSVGDEIKSLSKNVKIDGGLFNQILNLSMKLQPEFIQNMSAGELVEYLNSMNIQSFVDSKPFFEDLTYQMKFGDDVTEEQRRKLIETLSKVTDYFIAKGVEAKKLVNSAID